MRLRGNRLLCDSLSTRATNESGESEIPAGIENVATQLKNTFAYKSYSVMDVSMLRMGTSSNGRLDGNLESKKYKDAGYRIHVSPIEFSHIFSDPVVEIQEFQFSFRAQNLREDGNRHEIQAELGTSFSIRGDQSIVLGKLNAEGTSDAFFVVVKANILH